MCNRIESIAALSEAARQLEEVCAGLLPRRALQRARRRRTRLPDPDLLRDPSTVKHLPAAPDDFADLTEKLKNIH